MSSGRTTAAGRMTGAFWVGVVGSVVGLQIVRAFMPLVVYVYGPRPGVTSLHMGALAIAVFLTAWLAGPAQRLLGARLLAGTALAMAGVRVALQVVPAAVALPLAAAGVVAALWFWAALSWRTRAAGADGGAQAALALAAGLALDAAVTGAFGTWDVVWQRRPAAVATGVALAVLLGALAGRDGGILAGRGGGILATAHEHGSRARDGDTLPAVPAGGGWALAALGPLLFLHLLLFQNTARLAAVTGWGLPVALSWILASDLLAMAVGAWFRGPRVGPAAAVLLVPAAAVAHGTGTAAALALTAGTVTSVVLMVAAVGAPAARPGGSATRTAAWGLGMLGFAVPAFLYYVTYDIRAPLENAVIPPALAALAAVLAGRQARALAALPELRAAPVRRLRVLLLVPLLLWAVQRPPVEVIGAGWPARVMSYNLHQGYGMTGAQDLEALARTIEAEDADVVALQEVSRGWVINGSTDLLAWLTRRLRMAAAWAPAADTAWGNAVLSRRPILTSAVVPLPRGPAAMRRSVLEVQVEIGGRDRLLVLATHFHHVQADGELRRQQAAALVRLWNRRDRAVVLGDLNAAPDAPEIALLRTAGLRDAFEVAGAGDGHTFPAARPARRIDYIWVSPDRSVELFRTAGGPASDHLAVAATLRRESR